MRATTNTPCINPNLCGVKTHRPGTQAPCMAVSAKRSPLAQAGLSSPPKLASTQSTMPELQDSDFIHGIEEVEAAVEGFDRDIYEKDLSNAKFALTSIHIADVQTPTGKAISMEDWEIIEGGDSEYIEDLMQAVKDEGPDCFHPSVVIERDGHYEWVDGQHRMTALERSGVATTQAYVTRI